MPKFTPWFDAKLHYPTREGWYDCKECNARHYFKDGHWYRDKKSLRIGPMTIQNMHWRGLPKPQLKMKMVGSALNAGSPSFRSAAPGGSGNVAIQYVRARGADDFIQQVHHATPMQMIEVERNGVDARFLKDLSKRIDLPAARVFAMFGVPKATAEKKIVQGAIITGSGGRAAIAVAKLLGIATAIVENSTSPEANGFDSAEWFGQWLERPQPAFGGRKPVDLIDTPTGVKMVAKLLGAIESGAYQ
jgi:putative toxin-antitoxin system antitoxin component (TIGR02293 family)